MKKYLLVFALFMMNVVCYAHEPNQAFFDVFELDKKLVVKAEFPWTIRNVLLNTYPTLKNAETKEAMEAGLLAYLKEHIEITSTQNRNFILERIQELPNTGHSHGSLYLLVFDNYAPIKAIKNTCMFETYKDQQNFHVVEHPNKIKREYVTQQDSSSFVLEEPSNNNKYWISIVGVLVVILGAIFLFLKRNRG